LFLKSSVTGIISIALQQHVSLELATFIMCCACIVVENSHYVLYVAEKLHNLNSSANINGMVRIMMMRWAGNVARMVVKRNAYRVLGGIRKGERPTERPTRTWKDILIYMKNDIMAWTRFICLRIEKLGGSCEQRMNIYVP
jgi:hypothetical protein